MPEKNREKSLFLKIAFYYQFWFYTQNDKLIIKSYEACHTLLSPPLPSRHALGEIYNVQLMA